MPFKTVTLGGVEIEVDEDGFIQQPELWSESVALDLAVQDGIAEMTDDHWEVVNYIRNYWLKFEIAPLIRRLCKETHQDIDTIYDLFPNGPADGACKIAGLPTPTGCT
ncbi:MAG: TusE/DsrC/DsvC family sulfur relay protein [Candidatus Latescibacteria bacterium]|nr:TusE/DsrC/DsvC family sulfur relay protein [Candidatus Latescibacterota bacterium]MBT4139225.1 TusE/DsrC/DsvC family sulfur relay protein [Candidatus Latescibacterota bacterium]MBT5829855.1 TusE/DsrC/DsvC family sulfur relay protein [Candidatus Latescibacterota bacterium]